MLREHGTLRVRHKDGVTGTIMGRDPLRIGYFRVQFDDGVQTPQKSKDLFFTGESLFSLIESSEILSTVLSSLKEVKKIEAAWRQSRESNDQSLNRSCGCRGRDGLLKNSYQSKAVARMAAKRMPMYLRLRAYQCPDGNGWHLTKRPPTEAGLAGQARIC